MCEQHISIRHGTAADAIPVSTPIVVPAGCIANTMFGCDNGYTKKPVGSVTFGSRRFNISLEISVAEVLVVIDSVSQLFRIG